MVGCLGLFVVVIGLGILVAGQSVEGFLRSVGTFFDPSARTITTRGVFVPQLTKIQQLTTLASVRYSYGNMVTSEVDMPAALQALYGESLVLVAVGHVIAGIDLSAVREQDIVIDNLTRTITLTLPPPTLLECFLNEQQTYVAERNSGIFAASSPNLDLESRRYALQEFKRRALEEGILSQAQIEAETVLREFLTLVNEAGVTIILRATPPDPNAPLPETCR
jgi:hypothetical protein